MQVLNWTIKYVLCGKILAHVLLQHLLILSQCKRKGVSNKVVTISLVVCEYSFWIYLMCTAGEKYLCGCNSINTTAWHTKQQTLK